MESKPDLRPCPFCGGHGVKVLELFPGGVCYALCDICKAATRCFDTPKNAAEAWNRRAEPENRVLTLEEAAESGDSVWLEAMGTARIAQIYLSPGESLAECKTIGRAYPEYLYTGDYGKLWRCWLRKPTAEEMANAPWEELPCTNH